MFKTINSKFDDVIFRSAMISSCKRRDDGQFAVFPTKAFLFGDGYLLTAEQVPTFEEWYKDVLKTCPNFKSTFGRLAVGAVVSFVLMGFFFTLAEPLVLPLYARYLFGAGMLAILIWAVAIMRKRAQHLKSEFASSFPFPDAPTVKIGAREQLAMAYKSPVAISGMRWVLVLGLIVWGFMWILVFLGTSTVFLTVFMSELQSYSFGALTPELIMLLITVTVIMFLPVAACISGLGYRRRFYKQTHHPLTLENLYLYETGRLSPGDETLNPDQVITLFGRQWKKPSLSGVFLTVSAVVLVVFLLIVGVSERMALRNDGWHCINDRHDDDDKIIRQCTSALDVMDDPQYRAQLYLHRGASYRVLGQLDLAIADLNEAIRLNPEDEWSYANRGMAFYDTHQFSAASKDYQQAIALGLDDVVLHNQLAWLLATAPDAHDRDGAKAVEHAKRAVELDDEPYIRDTLAAALAELGRFTEAVEQQNIAIDIIQADDPSADVTSFKKKLSLYLNERPLRCPSEDCN